MKRSNPLLLCAALWTAAVAHAALPMPEHVTFPSLDLDASGKPVVISALYFRPAQAPADAKVPLIVAAHGCGGMFSTRLSRRDELSLRFATWTEEFLADGYAVLWPDSFNSRGRRSVCLVKRGEPTITPATRRLDILGALAFGAAQPGIDPTRTALVGWSHGGITTLSAVNGRDPKIAAFQSTPGSPPPFRAAVALYPGCGVTLHRGANWQPAMPLEIYTGELDDWTPSAPCVQLGEAARARGAQMTVTVYPGAYHGFDNPSGRVGVWKEVTTGVDATAGVHIGPDPAARAAADAAIRTFLRTRLSAAAPAASN